MSRKPSPRILTKLVDKQKVLERSLGYQQFADPRVDRFIRQMNPPQKKKIQNTMYWGPHRRQQLMQQDHRERQRKPVTVTGNQHPLVKDRENIIDVTKFTEKEELLSKKVQKLTISSVSLSAKLFTRKEEYIINQYKQLNDRSSIMLFVEDLSDTLTDVNYKRKIIKPTRTLEIINGSISFKTVNVNLFRKTLQDPTLTSLVDKIQVPKAFKELLGIEPMFKMVYINSGSLEIASDVISLFEKEKDSYRLFGVHINLETSPLITEELVEVLKGFNDRNTSTTSYEALLKIAKESQSIENMTTKNLLTTIGESNLLKVSIVDKGLSFTEHK